MSFHREYIGLSGRFVFGCDCPVSDGIEAGYEEEASSHGGKNIDVEFCGVFVVVIGWGE